MRKEKELLHVKKLNLSLYEKGELVKIVDDVDLKIHEGETVGLVGETGAGKTVTARSIMRILQSIGSQPLWKIEGEILYKGKDLLRLSEGGDERDKRERYIDDISESYTFSPPNVCNWISNWRTS